MEPFSFREDVLRFKEKRCNRRKATATDSHNHNRNHYHYSLPSNTSATMLRHPDYSPAKGVLLLIHCLRPGSEPFTKLNRGIGHFPANSDSAWWPLSFAVEVCHSARMEDSTAKLSHFVSGNIGGPPIVCHFLEIELFYCHT